MREPGTESTKREPGTAGARYRKPRYRYSDTRARTRWREPGTGNKALGTRHREPDTGNQTQRTRPGNQTLETRQREPAEGRDTWN